jgi:hypothetical protein
LTQKQECEGRVIAYYSRTLNQAERNYSVTEKECLAVKWGIWKMRQYLKGYNFIVITDHQALTWLERIDNPSGRLARWSIQLSQWDYEVRYRKGSENVLADALSREKYGVTTVGLKCSWYSEKYQEISENPDKDANYKIVDDRLLKKVFTSLNHRDSDEWKVCVP